MKAGKKIIAIIFTVMLAVTGITDGSFALDDNSSNTEPTAASEQAGEIGEPVQEGASAVTEEPAESEDAPAAKATESQTFTARDGSIKVTAEAPKGVFPDGVTMTVKKVEDADTIQTIRDSINDDKAKITAVDITFQDKNDKDIQPSKPIQITIKSDSFAKADDPIVIHVPDQGEPEQLTKKDNNIESDTAKKEVSFEADSFSVYAIIDPDTAARRNYIFQNSDGSNYTFLNSAGATVNTQIIKDGEYLEEVGIPTIDSDETFKGWYIWDPDTETFGEQVFFGEDNTIAFDESDAAGQTRDIIVRPKVIKVIYITFYENSAGTVVLQRRQVPVDEETGTATFDISSQNVAAPSSELAFVGWNSEPGTDDDNRTPITDTEITISQDTSFYPIFQAAHWLTFYTAPPGSGATYIAPAYVLHGETAASVEPSPDPRWTGYEFLGWFTEQEGGEPFDFNQELSSNITIYAHWRDAQANYTVVYWAQKVSDSVNATDSEKTYDFVSSEEHTSVKGTVITLSNVDTTSFLEEHEGFSLNTNNSTASIEVQADGSSVINVYYDRNAYTLTFTVSGDYYYDYVLATDDNGTQYAYVDGEYVELTRETVTTYQYNTRYTYTVNNTGGRWDERYGVNNNNEYTRIYYRNGQWRLTDSNNGTIYRGTRYSRNSNGQNYTGTRYIRSGNTFVVTTGDTGTQYGIDANGNYVELDRQTNTSYIWQLNGDPYTGARYKYQNTQSHIIRHITALYGQSVSSYFPITDENDGTSYNGYTWSDTGNPQTYEYVLETIEEMPAANVSFTGTSRGTGRTIYYYVEVVSGEDTGGLATRIFNGKTYKLYKTVQHSFRYITYNEEYHEITGFSRDRANAEPYFGQTYYYTSNSAMYDTRSSYNESSGSNINRAPIMRSEEANYLYYNRESYVLDFIDSATNQSISTATVQYEAPLSTYEPTAEPVSTRPGYKFKGWFKDAACTDPFDFTETMPASNVPVYAGWEEIWYRVEIDPNGGQLSPGESTFFWLGYGATIEEYGDITRDYLEDPDGTYYYHYHPYSEFQEDDYNQDDYYSKWDRCATYNEVTTTNHYDYNSETGQYDIVTTVEDIHSDLTKKYIYSEDAYALVGWYRVNEDGSLGSPYNFGEEVTDDIKIRAVWRRVGEYSVIYHWEGYEGFEDGTVDTDSTINGNPSSTAPRDQNTYADNSASAFLNKIEPPEGYIFSGWYYDGGIHNPGEVFTVDAAYADSAKNIHVYPVYTKIENAPVRVSHVYWYANNVDVDHDTITEDLAVDQSKISSLVLKDNYVEGETKASAEYDSANTRVNYNNVALNQNQPIVPAGTFSYDGYTFLGWAKSANATADQLFLKYENGKYYSKNDNGTWKEATAIAADESTYDDMYAIWRKAPDLTISKSVDNNVYADPNQTFTVRVTLSDSTGTAISGAYTYSIIDIPSETTIETDTKTFDSLGNAEFTVKDGYTVVIEDLPYGASYAVVELNVPANFTVAYTGGTALDAGGVGGVLDGDKTVGIINTAISIIPTGIKNANPLYVLPLLTLLAILLLLSLLYSNNRRRRRMTEYR